MPHILRVDETRSLLEVVYQGALTASERADAIHEGGRMLSALQYRRVLVDLRDAVIQHEPTHVLTNLAHDMAHAPAVQSSRLAYLVTPEQETNRIVENMATARHMTVARFQDRDTAIAWLLQDPPDDAADA